MVRVEEHPVPKIESVNRLHQSVWALAIACAWWCGAGDARAQDAAADGMGADPEAVEEAAASRPSPAVLLEDYTHYVKVANVEMAAANARALLDYGLSATEFVGLVEDGAIAARFDEANRRAMRIAELEELAAELANLYEGGKKERARDPDEIDRNIGLLTGTQRGKILARERLLEAGEYAVPQLLSVLEASDDLVLRAEVQRILIGLGRDAVGPLSAALPHVEPATQELLVNVLGSIDYGTSLPYLYELQATTTSEPVKSAARKAIERVQGSFDESTSVGELFRNLGEEYYSESRSLTSFPGESHQLLWSWVTGVGLNPTAIRTEVYHEARAMELAERTLKIDPQNELALSLWLAANFRREIEQPADYENPVYGPDRRDPTYYAVAAGSTPVQRVLRRALDDRDTALALKAISALGSSAGGAALWVGLGDSRPLVDALSYPDRRVQYEAALVLGRAGAAEAYEGSERVVPILASAVRDPASRYALVISHEVERQQSLRSMLEGLGYTVLPPSTSLSATAEEVSRVPGIDMIVALLSGSATVAMIEEARLSARLSTTPILALLPYNEILALGDRFESDQVVRLVRMGLNDEQLAENVRQLAERATGAPLNDEEAAEYAIRALSVLRELAVSGRGGVLDISDAATPLIDAIAETQGSVQLRIAQVLSYIPQQRAQVALMDAAMDAQGEDRVALLGIVADSAKRFGNLLEERQIQRLVQLVEDGEDEEATAAAALTGALNLPNSRLVPVIVE